MKLTGPECKYFYLCDKKPGACKRAKIVCPNKDCHHTTNEKHAKNKAGRRYNLIVNEDGSAERWEVENE